MSSGLGMSSKNTQRRLLNSLRERGIQDERVLAAMTQVPRHLFVDEALRHRAYENTVLPIGYQQNISSPFIVAFMTQRLLLNRDGKRPLDKVLEIGVGCGYQTAVLAGLSRWVCGIELIPELLRQTKARLANLGILNWDLRVGDGWQGWTSSNQSFEAILCAAAAEGEVPQPLTDSLAVGGQLLLPVGPPQGPQYLREITRLSDDEFSDETLPDEVLFVPFVKGQAYG